MFWALNNMIAASDNCALKISKKQIRAAVMNDLSLSSEEFERFITILTHECELIINLDGYITKDIVRDSLQLVMKDREEARKRYQKDKGIKQTKIFSI